MSHTQTVLVTGGAGYIGSHILTELVEGGYRAVVLDNLDNGSPVAIERVRSITGCSEDKVILETVDLLDLNSLEAVFRRHCSDVPFCACIHLAGLKAVGESVKLPLIYYHNNVTGTMNLLSLLQKFKCHNFVFSSSACVYGDPGANAINESTELKPENPYGETKVVIENMLQSISRSQPGEWRIISLRYFNPIGAHPSGLIGEDPQGFPNNLLPYVAQVAVGKREKLYVFGNDYPTADGTGVRDYIHVTDLSKGHVAALNRLLDTTETDWKDSDSDAIKIYNLGTGSGVSVLEVVEAYGRACGKPIPYEFAPRRPGDSAVCFADASKAAKELNWVAGHGIDDMCRDAWKWQSSNPNGYRSLAEANAKQIRKGLVFSLYKE